MKSIALFLLAFSLVTILPAMSQDANYWLAQTESDFNNGSYSLALDDIDEYLDINSSDLWAWNFKANLLIKMKRYSDAVDSFDQIIQLDSSNAQAYNDRALILSGGMRQDEEALDFPGYGPADQLQQCQHLVQQRHGSGEDGEVQRGSGSLRQGHDSGSVS